MSTYAEKVIVGKAFKSKSTVSKILTVIQQCSLHELQQEKQGSVHHFCNYF